MNRSKEMAFPGVKTGEHGGLEATCTGLTKREYVAAKALEGLLSNADWMKNTKSKDEKGSAEEAAKMAILCANLLLDGLGSS